LISENYLSPLSQENDVSMPLFDSNGNLTSFQEGSFTQKNTIWFGISGVRFVNRKNSIVSFQLGLSHIVNIEGKIPSPYNQPQWEDYSGSDFNFVAFPTISYTRKFKLK
jgi:hypothetical protein